MNILRLPVVALILALAIPSGAAAERLTLERMFADPGLAGPSPRRVKLSPDGRRVTFLKGKETNQDQLDLWEYHVESGVTRLLVDSDRLLAGPVELSDEEKARRERMRIAGTTGIVEYDWSPDGAALLFPLGGDLFVYDLDKPPTTAARRMTETTAFETDARFSPRGRYVSFVREQDLYVFDLERGVERRLTTDGGGVIRNGMAEFVAQEEMGRFTGYWWSPDETRIAFTRVDESPVSVSDRFEIYADAVQIFKQRYPYAGTPNARVDLFVIETRGGGRREINYRRQETEYLYRVDWFPGGRQVAVQRQPRHLQSLDLMKCGVADGACHRLLRETSPTWIELQDNLIFLKGSERFIWSSRRDGFEHLYLYDLDGKLIRRLTEGSWEVTGGRRGVGVLGVDEDRRMVYFLANQGGPLELHLYEQSLDTRRPARVRAITGGAGIHDVELSEDASLYVDSFSSIEQPPRVSIHTIDGKRLAWLEENRVGPDHPYRPYIESHITPEFGAIAAADGQELHYRLYKPAEFDPSRRYPVLLYVYGGPRGQTVKRSWGGTTEMWLQLMAQRGYVVFTIDNRGTGYRGTDFDAPIYKRLGRIEVEDQLAGVMYLKSLKWVDPERIGVFGWSYGGYMTLMLMLQAPDLFAAGVSGAPVTDWALYDTYYTERFLGLPERNPQGYELSSVFPFVDNLKGELLIIHGMADDNVLFTNSTRLFKALQDAGKPFEMMTYPGAKHSLARIADTGAHALGTATRFLDRALRP